jgi:uncharacterized protein (DUF2384 family)
MFRNQAYSGKYPTWAAAGRVMTSNRRETAVMQTALELFFTVARKLGASESDQGMLLGVSRRTVRSYRDRRSLPKSRDMLERISHITTIWLTLSSLFQTDTDVVRWLRSPHEKYGGASPFEHMLGGNVSDLVDVRCDVETVEPQCTRPFGLTL